MNVLDFVVVASKILEGKRKDGSPYHFCRCWVELSDGSLHELVTRRDYVKGEVVSLDLVAYGSGLKLVERRG